MIGLSLTHETTPPHDGYLILDEKCNPITN